MSAKKPCEPRLRKHRSKVAAGALGLALLGTGVIATTAEAAVPDPGDPRATAFSGNVNRCPDGSTSLLSAPDGGSSSNPLVTATITGGGRLVDLTFASSLTGAGVIAFVKGANAYNQYVITVGTTDTAGLHAPLNKQANIPGVSHYLVCGTTPPPPPPPPPPQFGAPPELFLGYADDFHGVGGGPFPFLPTPWKGDPGVVYVGCSGSTECGGTGTGKFDSGAIRIDNVDPATPLRLTAASVDIGPCRYTPWTALLPATAAPGGKFVLAQSGILGPPMPSPCADALDPLYHAETNFDTSERPGDTRNPPSYDCNPPVRHTPVITLSFEDGPAGPDGDVTLTINDTAMILNTGGSDRFACLGQDEATPWTGPISSTP